MGKDLGTVNIQDTTELSEQNNSFFAQLITHFEIDTLKIDENKQQKMSTNNC